VGNGAEELLRLARGADDRPVEPDRERKSLSSEQTFATDVRDESILSSVLLEEVEEVAERLRRHQIKARTITLKLRYGDFRTVTRSETLREATNLTKPLWEAAGRVFRQWQARSGGALRLLGFAASGLEPEQAGQQLLFPDPEQEKLRRLDQIVDKIRDRYGRRAVHRGPSSPENSGPT
jgi:DNA polymerase-4